MFHHIPNFDEYMLQWVPIKEEKAGYWQIYRRRTGYKTITEKIIEGTPNK